MRWATPACFTAETESPPPTMDVAVALSATAWAMFMVPAAKAGISKTPMGPFQTMVLAPMISSEKRSMVLGPMSRPIQSAGKFSVSVEDLGVGVGGEFVGEDVIDGQQEADTVGLGFGESFFGGLDLVGFEQRLADFLTLGFEEGVGHAAADEQRIDLAEQVVDDFDFVGDFGSAENRDEGPLGRFEGLAHVVQFFFHQQAGGGLLHEVSDAFGRGVGAMGAAEGVVDVNLAEAGQLFCEVGIVGLFFGVEAQVFEEQHLPGFELARELGCDLADAIGREGDVEGLADLMVEQHAQAVDDGAQAVLRIDFALGTAEMRGEDHLRLMSESVLNGRQRFADASVVGDLRSVFAEWDVEINADEYMLVLQIEVADGKFGHSRSLIFTQGWAVRCSGRWHRPRSQCARMDLEVPQLRPSWPQVESY